MKKKNQRMVMSRMSACGEALEEIFFNPRFDVLSCPLCADFLCREFVKLPVKFDLHRMLFRLLKKATVLLISEMSGEGKSLHGKYPIVC